MTKKTSLVIVGGTGFNIGAEVIDSTILNCNNPTAQPGFPSIQVVGVDTTSSNVGNLHKLLLPDDLFIIPNIDGSGKNQAEAVVNTKQYVDSIVRRIDGDMIILVASAAGGSGSAMLVQLTKQLIERNKTKKGTAICLFLIASSLSELETINCKNTLASLMAISEMNSTPVIMNWYKNSEVNTRDKINELVAIDIKSLMVLSSGKNLEMDSTDIYNMFNYNKVTAVTPRLTQMYIYRVGDNGNKDKGHMMDHTNVIAVASLLRSTQDVALNVNQLYSTVGYFPADIIDSSKLNEDPIPEMNFIITSAGIGVILNELNDRLNEFKSHAETINQDIVKLDINSSGINLMI